MLGLLGFTGLFVYYYVRFSRLIDARLSGDIFNNASLVFAAPTPVSVGQAGTPEEVARRLRRALYAESSRASSVGVYRLTRDGIEITPGPISFFTGEVAKEGPAILIFRDGRITSITSPDGGTKLASYDLEPEVITTLFDNNRSKRRLVRYQDLPKVLRDAVLAAEDHRFFSHHGVDIFRIPGAAVADIRADRNVQGSSTLTMQLARGFFLTPARVWRRKLEETFLAFLLEQRLTKEQIFELYANQIYLGQRGSFSIYGFGEAANSYFNKDVASLTLPEAAFLAGLIRGPNLYSPYRRAARTLERRNFVIRQMLNLGMITSEQAEKASGAELGVMNQNVEGLEAPYFVDMVRDQLLVQFSERDLISQSYRIYTTLDLDLQKAASEGARQGISEVDQELRKSRHARSGGMEASNQPQLALVSLDAHTGEIKALVGGRDYAYSQLNHVLAKRQPGSSFKPFVYAAALSTAVDGSQPLITPATVLNDEPTTFHFGDLNYEPENYKQEYHGIVTLREALTHSLNVATVRLAEMVGYDKVRDLAIAAGINKDLLATPAIALGSYVATPLEISGAYTIFSNGGQYVEPRFILAVNDSTGTTLWRNSVVTRQVLDPRVSYLMVDLMESVVNNGTGAGVRTRGFTLPAAGKTGTSHDGWFAGFTSDLLAIVWVGYDDDRELRLAGSASALPIWTEFMKRAAQVPGYADPKPFAMPEGVVSVPLETNSTTSDARIVRNEVFIAGTEPQATQVSQGILGRLFHPQGRPNLPAAAAIPTGSTDVLPPGTAKPPEGSSTEDRHGIIKKFLSIFKGKDSKPAAPPQTENETTPQK
ncbi:MAG: PBP1A family penicillin-binding protein [Terriglobia bacterium]